MASNETTGDSTLIPRAHGGPSGEGEDWFRRATYAGRVGVWDWDVLTDTVTWSDVIYEIHGLEKGTFGGTVTDFAELVHEDDRPHVNDAIHRAIHHDHPYDVEFRAVRPDGGIVWISSHAEVRRDEAGRAVNMHGAMVDVTARRHTEEALRRSEQRFRVMANAVYRLSAAVTRAARLEDIFDAAMNGLMDAVSADRASVLLFDDEDVMRFRGWRGLSERYRHAVEGHSPWMPGDADATPITASDVMTDPALVDLRRTFIDEGIGALSFIPLVSANRVVGKFMVYYDQPHEFSEEEVQVCQTIADHVAYAIERGRSERALQESNRRKDEFLALLGHELRNPLGPLSNMLEVMETDDLQPELLHRARRTMARQVDHLVRLVNDLLDVNRISRGLITLRPERLELCSLARDAADDCLPILAEKQQELTVTSDEPVVLHADPTRVTQVLGNLLNNASKFTDPGGQITLEVELNGKSAVVRVRDTGMGIEPDRLPHIFDMFSRARDPREEPRFGGLGIGLTLVKNLVEMHGGTIEVRSEGIGMGSEFIVRLPIDQDSDIPGRDGVESHEASNGVSPRRVLVVDDNRDAADALSVLLTLHGHEVRTVFDGLEAVEAAASWEPEVILLDLGMPKLDGVEAARRIRARQSHRKVFLVALTGWSQEEDRRRTERAGFDAHLVKPVNIEQLSSLLAAYGED